MIDLLEIERDDCRNEIQVFSLKDSLKAHQREELAAPHRLGFHALILVTEGSGLHYIDNKLYQCQPGTLLILNPQQVHHFESAFLWQGLCIAFPEDTLFDIDNDWSQSSLIKFMRGVNVMENMAQLISPEFKMLHAESKAPKDVVSGKLQRNLLQNILYKIFLRNSYAVAPLPRERDVKDFQSFNDLVERDFQHRHNVSDYSRELRVSTKRLNLVCKQLRGMSAKQIVDARLLLEAKRLIGYSNKPISQISTTLGFNEPTNLAKFFRKHTNTSPSEFRNMSKPLLNTTRGHDNTHFRRTRLPFSYAS